MSKALEKPPPESDEMTSRQRLPNVVISLVLSSMFTTSGVMAWNLGVGSMGSPGPGLWPMLASVSGGLLSLVLLGSALVGRTDQEAELFGNVHWVEIIIFIISVVAFLAFYPLVGFLLSAIPMTFVLMRFAAGGRVLPALITSMTAPLILFLIFRELLNVRV